MFFKITILKDAVLTIEEDTDKLVPDARYGGVTMQKNPPILHKLSVKKGLVFISWSFPGGSAAKYTDHMGLSLKDTIFPTVSTTYSGMSIHQFTYPITKNALCDEKQTSGAH